MNSFKTINIGTFNPVVSIAMLAYNHSKYIEKAIDSVLMQKTSYAYKIVIAEDCSTDDTREIILRYKEKYPDKFKLILQDKNVGSRQNNFDLLTNLEGKYVAALEGDDYWTDPLKLQKQIDVLEQTPNITFTFHGAKTLDNDGNFATYYKHPDFRDKKTVDTAVFLQKLGASFSTGSLIMKIEVISELPNWFINAHIGDYPLMFMALEKGKIGYLKDEMSVYRLKSEASWSSKNMTLVGRWRNFKKMVILNHMINEGTNGKYKQYLQFTIFSFIMNKIIIVFKTRFYKF